MRDDIEKLQKEYIYLANKIAFLKIGFFEDATPTELAEAEARHKYLSEKLKIVVDKSE